MQPKRHRPRPADDIIASKSRPGPKTNKQDRVVSMLRQPGGATIEEIAVAIGWKASAITRIVQWLLFATRSGVREISSKKRSDGTTVYKAA